MLVLQTGIIDVGDAARCQKAGDGCEAFTYFPDGNARINQVCYHSKRCLDLSMVPGRTGGMDYEEYYSLGVQS